MRFCILRPLAVHADDGSPMILQRPSQRATLAVLLLQRTTATSRSALSDALWGEDPPAGADAALRVRMCDLRRALAGQSRIETVPGGYRIMVRDGELDAEVFRSLTALGRAALDQGRPREAAGYLDEACKLWGNPPLADVPDSPLLRPLTAALLEQLRDAREWLVDARLRLGHHYEVLSQLRAAVAADPLSEHQYVQLMLALYRCGHKTAALDTYSRLREMTAREFGLDPGPEAQELLRRILADTEDLQFRPRLLAASEAGPQETSGVRASRGA